MTTLPEKTRVHRRIPKEAFYQRLALSPSVKNAFAKQIAHIFVENSLTKESLDLSVDSDLDEILVLLVEVKTSEYEPKIFEAIARANPHKIVFRIVAGKNSRLALYFKRLYQTPWTESETLISFTERSLARIWEELASQIALTDERVKNRGDLDFAEKLALQERVAKLEKQIERAEDAVHRESQPRKKFDLFNRVKALKAELKALLIRKLE